MPLPKDYFINTEKDGRLGTTTEDDVTRLFAILRERDRIVVHVHGGLITETGGHAGGAQLLKPYLDAGAHPIFFIWESDLVSVVTRNLPEIFAEDLFKIIRKRVLKYVAAKLGLGGLVPEAAGVPAISDADVIRELARLEQGREPFDYLAPVASPGPVTTAEEQALVDELSDDPDFRATLDAIAAEAIPTAEAPGAVRVRASLRTLASPEVVDEIVAERVPLRSEALGIPSAAIRAGKILFRVIRRFIQKRDHGPYQTVVEEILREFYVSNVGSKVWAAMKKETADTFEATPGQVRGGQLFLDKLAELLGQLPQERWPKVTLIGHSAGAALVNNLLLDVQRRRDGGTFPAAFTFEQVIFEAPACTFTQCAAMLRRCSGLFRHFRMFALSDERERADAMIPLVYLSSLLYFVSGVTEFNEEGKPEADVPLVGMQRYHDMVDVYDGADVIAVRRYIASDAGRSVWAPAAHGEGQRCDARHHGEVDNDPVTVASVQHILRTGIQSMPSPVPEGLVPEAAGAGESLIRSAARARVYRAFGVVPPAAPQAIVLEAPGGDLVASVVPDAGGAPPLTLAMIDLIEARLQAEPEAVMAQVRAALLSDVTEEDFRAALARARDLLTHPERHAPLVEATLRLEATPPPLPDGFAFPGMDLESIPINYESHQFETGGDVLRWIFVSGPSSLFPPKKAPFRDPAQIAGRCTYAMREPTAERPVSVALFADFGTGLYHSRYIARQLQASPCEYALHLGDVYYNGTEREFADYLKAPIEPILERTEFFTLNSNHEMLSGAVPYFAFLDWKRARYPTQRQEGSMFTLANNRVQFVAIDTDHESLHRFKASKTPGAWVRERLADGRRAGLINILLSADEPYTYGKAATTDLWNDLRDIIGDHVDLWFWGNTHYCALFDWSATTPFIGSCIGHGGYPYGIVRTGKPTPAPLLFLETATRFPAWTKVRLDRGNNGYVRMSIPQAGPLAMQYVDWMARVRCEVEFVRNAAGQFRPQLVREDSA